MYEGDTTKYADATIAGPEERDSEISREIRELRNASKESQELAERLIQRLAAVLSPTPETTPKEKRSSPSTPLATNIREINDAVTRANGSLSFILQGLQL